MGVKMPQELAHNLEQLVQRGHRGFYDWITQQHPNHTQHTTHEMLSSQFIRTFPNQSFDCVYLDGDHSYETVNEELKHFDAVPTLCGDDYGEAHPGVMKAVKELKSRHPQRVWQEPKHHLRSGFWSLVRP